MHLSVYKNACIQIRKIINCETILFQRNLYEFLEKRYNDLMTMVLYINHIIASNVMGAIFASTKTIFINEEFYL